MHKSHARASRVGTSASVSGAPRRSRCVLSAASRAPIFYESTSARPEPNFLHSASSQHSVSHGRCDCRYVGHQNHFMVEFCIGLWRLRSRVGALERAHATWPRSLRLRDRSAHPLRLHRPRMRYIQQKLIRARSRASQPHACERADCVQNRRVDLYILRQPAERSGGNEVGSRQKLLEKADSSNTRGIEHEVEEVRLNWRPT